MKKLYIYLGIGVALIGLFVGFLAIRVGPVQLGAAPPGLSPTVASTTQFSIATAGAVRQIVGTSTQCSSRIVTTDANGVGLAFNDQPLDVRYIGHWQAASTTVAYDGEVFGCGVMRARVVASSTVIITEHQ